MFYDRAKIYVKAGDGGNGSVHFLSNRHAPHGGPDGGDGGRGGNVLFEVDPGMSTLLSFHRNQHFKAGNGGNGLRQRMHGAKGVDVICKVPAGTVIQDGETGETLADLTKTGQQYMVVEGGRGGLGNTHYATSTRQAPREAQLGEPGEERWLSLELKLIADVGLAGYPNAGKSTLLAAVSAATPKIADYPFTTLQPNLGVVSVDDVSFVLADIPGLIEGASEGAGLGLDFLRHVERTRLIIHVVDGTGMERGDPLRDFDTINKEMAQYSTTLGERPQIVAINKMDLPETRERWPKIKRELNKRDYKVFPISAATGEGVRELMFAVLEHLRVLPLPLPEVAEDETVFKVKAPDAFTVEKEDEGFFIVQGARVARILNMTNIESEESVARLQLTLKKMGVTAALQKAGVKDGDTVEIGTRQLIWGENAPERKRRSGPERKLARKRVY